MQTKTTFFRLYYATAGAGIVLLLVALYLGFSLYQKHQALAETSATLAEAQSELAALHERFDTTLAALEAAEEENDDLRDDLRDEKNRNEDFEDQIQKITGTVGQLDKLSKTDPELLQKYSKVFFLNEHYMPEKLVALAKKYLSDPAEPTFIHAEVESFLEDMIDDAADDDVELKIVSAFRSFDTQASLKGAYTVTYGSGANAFSADQGYSEHQLGTTIDLTTTNLGGGLDGFQNTPAYAWLTKNAYRYGFVLSYPENNAYYIFEPWHWRFVGTDLADDLHDDKKYFYDLDQREIDTYLVSIFD
ncbi:M15 family metallopeptidase [Candidatus Kaiserbacteria bacterium]|nr:M15 family metallopeptidase [Candidatus Kaiserbacteria bacterium]